MKRVLITLCVLYIAVTATAQEKEVKWTEFKDILELDY